MIGSFWNLCRACPSMPVDKFHSEYRSTYRWHEYTGGSRPEVIRKPPVTNQFASNADHFFSKSTEDDRHGEGTINEPPLPRRKKCPELAYRHHEFILRDGDTRKNDLTATAPNRARSEERGTPSRRSKSEGPHRVPNGQVYPVGDVVDGAGDNSKGGPAQAGESSGLFRKTISKLSTEYRIQYIWPYLRKETKGSDDVVDFPKKSISMGAIRTSNAMPTVHKKRTVPEKEATTQELEPLCVEEKPEKRDAPVRKSTVRPHSQYANEIKYKNAHTEKENFGFSDNGGLDKAVITNGISSESWLKDVLELRKQAESYKNRGWGVELNPDLFSKQKELWDQVSRRSSLSALSLASSVHKPITKEEKEAANNLKTSPTKSLAKGNASSHVQFINNKSINDNQNLTNRALNIRHYLDLEDSGLSPSPTREKLMPAISKRDDESYNSQRGSPKKGVTSRHGSPQKGSPQKQAKKPVKQTKARSQSVGPTSTSEGSPKRQARSGSAVPASTATATVTKAQKKTPVSTPTIVERRPRPTTLSTTNHYRSKSSSLPPTGRTFSAPGNHHIPNQMHTDTNKLSPSNLTIPLRKTYRPAKHQRPQSAIVLGNFDPMTASTIIFNEPHKTKGPDRKTGGNEDDTDMSSASPLPAHEIYEHIVKSPPEPTRVKSPEQILMRSPDPVNWIVPLDTGKTFTVTQNVRDGEPNIRPHSEFKATTPIERPSVPSFSAPPEFSQPKNVNDSSTKSDHDDNVKSDKTESSTLNYDKPVPGSTLRCLDDPSFHSEINSPVAKQTVATDSLDKAHDRFDRFWSGGTGNPNDKS